MRVDWAFIAQSAIGDSSGVVSVLGVALDTFQSIEASSLPEAIQQSLQGAPRTAVRFFVVIRMLAARVELGRPHNINIAIQTEDGATVVALQGGMLLAPNPALPTGWDQPVVAPFDITFVPPRYGQYSVEIIVDGDHKKSIPFRVLQAEVPAPPAQ